MRNGPATADEISQFVGDLLDTWNAHEVERIKAFYAPEYEGVDVGQAKPQRGSQGIRQTAVS